MSGKIKMCGKSALKSNKPLLSAFLKNRHGSIAPTFALSFIPIILSAGVAVDLYRITKEQSSLGLATDAACVAVATDGRSNLDLLPSDRQKKNVEELKALATSYVKQNHNKALGQASLVDLTVEGQVVKAKSLSKVPMTFTKLAGFSTVDVSADCTVTKAARGVELVMVMDTTGSMKVDDKIGGSKTAARTLLETIYGGTKTQIPEHKSIRVALVPFSSAVRLDRNASDFKLDWVDTSGRNLLSHIHFNASNYHNYRAWGDVSKATGGKYSWDGCVEARSAKLGYNLDDTPPSSADGDTLFPVYFSPDTPPTAPGSMPYSVGGRTSPNAPPIQSQYIESKYWYERVAGSNDHRGRPTSSRVELKTEGWYNELTQAQIEDYSPNGMKFKQNYEGKYKYKFRSFSSSDQEAYNNPSLGCATSKIIPLTYDRMNVEDGIDAMSPFGATIIPEGLAWGWRVLSPTEPFTLVEGSKTYPKTKIAAYGQDQASTSQPWRKVMILMTDGDNAITAQPQFFDKSFYTAYGHAGADDPQNRFFSSMTAPADFTTITNQTSAATADAVYTAALDRNMLSLCSNIKAQGIDIYVTSFGNSISTATQSKLKACASRPENYKHNATSEELKLFFKSIGNDLLNSLYVSG